MSPNLRGKPLFIIIATALLYIPAIYILLSQFFPSDVYTSEGNVKLPEGGNHDKPITHEVDTGKSTTGLKDAPIQGVFNSTLGFEKIYFISLPERTDRQDAMKLVASYMGLQFTYIPGVNGSAISDRALPYDTKNKPNKPPSPAELGCWRAHANVWSKMLDDNISSALILEDDIDFTIGIKEVLHKISTHLQTMTGARHGETYGLVDDNSWDAIHLGNCFVQRPPAKEYPVSAKILQAWEDEYAPVMDKHNDVLSSAKSGRIRLLHPTYGVACTQAYVVSQAGARRMLYHIGGPGNPLYRPIDLVMLHKFHEGKLKGYTVSPSLFGQWKNGDAKDSDIPKDQEWEIEVGSGPEVIKGVRTEMKNVWGARNVWKEMEKSGHKARTEKHDRRR